MKEYDRIPVSKVQRASKFITTGEMEVHELVSPSLLETILSILKEEKGLPNSGLIKSKLPNDFSYGEIKAAMKYWESNNN